jgi:hypothetical protein
MPTYMLTWNPIQSRPKDLRDTVATIADGSQFTWEWSTGNRSNLPRNSRIFLVGQGKEPRGVVASGYCVEEPVPTDDPHSHSKYGVFALTAALDADRGQLLRLSDLLRDPVLRHVPWGIACGGRQFSLREAEQLELLWAKLLNRLKIQELEF